MSAIASTRRLDLTRHVGTELEGFRFLDMSDDAVTELLHLVADRGVVVVRDQPMTIPE